MGNCFGSCLNGVTEEEFEEFNYTTSEEGKVQREEAGVGEAKSNTSHKKEKGVVRVKIVLSKQEAARLLSKFEGGDGGVLGAVISELKRPDDDRSSAVAVGPCRGGWRPVLESIPENH